MFLAWLNVKKESFGPCVYCDDKRPLTTPTVILNPYVWPYSGTGAVEDIYIEDIDNAKGLKYGYNMTNRFVPDHALKTE